MRIDILTLFPGIFSGFLDGSLLGQARERGIVDIRLTDIRDFAEGVHRQVDDRPFGGGPGMLLMPGPVVSCVEAVESIAAAETGRPGHLVMLSPGGRRLDQRVVEELASRERLTLLCGRYEGFDHRIGELLRPDVISIGDYVLSGGEVAAMAVVEAVTRLLPGVLGDASSAVEDSFSGSLRLVEGPQYTRPREFRGLQVPEVLLSGDHRRIEAWRREQAIAATDRRAAFPEAVVASGHTPAIQAASPQPDHPSTHSISAASACPADPCVLPSLSSTAIHRSQP